MIQTVVGDVLTRELIQRTAGLKWQPEDNRDCRNYDWKCSQDARDERPPEWDIAARRLQSRMNGVVMQQTAE